MVYFFFSSRRRHTRWPRDWSSDVCSSDLRPSQPWSPVRRFWGWRSSATMRWGPSSRPLSPNRSEERRVGKECRSRRWPEHYRKKRQGVESRERIGDDEKEDSKRDTAG